VKPEPKPIPKVEPKPEPLPPKKPDIAVKEEKKKAGAEEAGTQARAAKPPKPEPKTEAAAQVRFQQGTGARNFRPEAAPEHATTGQCGSGRSRAAGIVEQEGPGRLRQQDPHEGARQHHAAAKAIQGNPEAVFEVSQLPTGEVLDVKLKRSSGNQALDAAIERAIRKSSPLPKPDDPSLFQRTLEIKYKPFEE
jgi:colicin import membrane protein